MCFAHVNSSDDNFVVIDSDGLHTVALDYCGCAAAVGKVEQLLRFCLFPATTSNPHTAATFRVLETFQMLSFMSRVSAFEFLRALERRTDNTGTIPVPVSSSFSCYPFPFLNMTLYRNGIWLGAVLSANGGTFAFSNGRGTGTPMESRNLSLATALYYAPPARILASTCQKI